MAFKIPIPKKVVLSEAPEDERTVDNYTRYKNVKHSTKCHPEKILIQNVNDEYYYVSGSLLGIDVCTVLWELMEASVFYPIGPPLQALINMSLMAGPRGQAYSHVSGRAHLGFCSRPPKACIFKMATQVPRDTVPFEYAIRILEIPIFMYSALGGGP